MIAENKVKKLAVWQEEMEGIAKRTGGILRPADVEAFARNPKTALHSKFQWDDTVAAHQYRLWQARELIAVVVEIMPQIQKSCRVYVSMAEDRQQEGGGYRTIVSVLGNRTRREKLLAEALEEFDRWKAKYELLTELAEVFESRAKVRAR